MGTKERILIVDDQPSVRFGLRSLLEGEGYRTVEADCGAQALAALSASSTQLILLDLRLPDIDGLSLLPRIKAIDDDVPVLLITAHGTIEAAVHALKAGAENFLTKPLEGESLLILVAKTLEQSRARRERLLKGLTDERVDAEYFIGSSEASVRVHRTIERLAPSDATVLLQGETGTGKGMAARYIHRLSERAGKPFVAINCAGLNRDLLESELFGHEKGAFTGAAASKPGLFELAHEGTFLFDEIAEMEPSIQAKLLTAMEHQKFRRVGGVQEREVDVRIVAATNRDLLGEVKRGRFREDLYYRLTVMQVTLPPLRERREDILPLVEHFVARFNRKLNRKVREITPKAEALLLGYSWPGNIRELRNVVERAMILCNGDRVHASDLPLGGQEPVHDERPCEDEEFLTLDTLERLHIERVLAAAGRNHRRTAEMLGITRSTLYNKLRRYGVESGER